MCAFKHLTEFAVCLGPPPQANRLAPLGETLNFAEFVRDNPMGVLLTVASLLMLWVTCACAMRQDRNWLAQNGRDITRATLSQSSYVQQLRGLQAGSWPIMNLAKTNLRTDWTCGSLWYPIEADPMSRLHRLFVLCATLNITLAVNMLFFRFSGKKEICEATAGVLRNCTMELLDAEQCTCKVCKSRVIRPNAHRPNNPSKMLC
jgi:hypothetical protein